LDMVKWNDRSVEGLTTSIKQVIEKEIDYISNEYLPLDQMYEGIAATDSLREVVDAEEPSDNIDLFYQSFRNYYIVLIKQIQHRFKLEDEIY